MRLAKDGGVVENETEGDRVAVGVAECVQHVFTAKVTALGHEEIRPAAGAEDSEDIKGVRG